MVGFIEDYTKPFIVKMLKENSPVPAKEAAILAFPYMSPWSMARDSPIPLWAATASVVPHTDEIGQSVVTALLQIASDDSLRPDIPVGMWSWLNRRPSLPLDCAARRRGGDRDVVQTIRALGDIQTLTSYLHLVWSECNMIYPGALEEMCASIREDFGGIWMGCDREDLLRRLDYISGQLDLGLDHLLQHEPSLDEDDIRLMKGGYGQLKEALLEVDGEAIDRLIRESLGTAIVFGLLTPVDRLRVPLNVHVCGSPPVPVVAHPDHFTLLPSTYDSIPSQSTLISSILLVLFPHLLVVFTLVLLPERR